MALPPYGIISMDDIRVELGVPSQAPFDIDIARQGGYVILNPYSPTMPPYSGTVSLASWYSYCQACTPLYSFTIYYEGFDKTFRGWGSAIEACAGWGTYSLTVYSSSSTLAIYSSLFYLSGTVYYPLVLSSFGAGFWLYDSANNQAIELSTSTIVTIVPCTSPTYYYYEGNYWVDCAGVTATGVIIRATTILSMDWTRVTGAYSGYFYLTGGIDPGPGYTYESDDSQNSYCGY